MNYGIGGWVLRRRLSWKVSTGVIFPGDSLQNCRKSFVNNPHEQLELLGIQTLKDLELGLSLLERALTRMAGLKNKYYVLRHGRSRPNEEGLIVSLMSNGVLPMYGLAPSGVLQAKAAGMTLAKELEGLSISPDCVRIYASPFSRTTQTAQAVADVLESSSGTKPSIQLMEELRERFFGPSLELQSHEHYSEIWAIDALDPMVGPEGGESVADVGCCVSQAILSIN